MSGHSKWNNIMHKKAKTDAQRAKVFTKIGREISMAVKEGGPDPVSNSKLKDLIAKAKSNNVPNENIERLIKKASGADNTDNYENITYEGYGPCGVAVIVETLTDNRNRTAGDMRHFFDKNGGNMGQSGSVSWMFSKKGIILIESDGVDADELMMCALDNGATDFAEEDEVFEITCEPADVYTLKEKLEAQGYTVSSAEASMIPSTYARVEGVRASDGESNVKLMSRLLEMLEDNDDVQNVWHNVENVEDVE